MTVCGREQKELWNSLIGKDDEIYYHWSYNEAFYKMGDGEPTLFYLSDKNTRIYCVLMRRKISDLELFKDFSGYYDVSTPYGYGGTTMKGALNFELLEQFFDEMTAYCTANKIVSEYQRLDPVSRNAALYAGQPYDCTDFSKTVCMSLQSPEQIWSDMKSQCRNHIRKAIKNEISVKSGYDEQFMRIFRDIYTQTMERRDASSYYFFNNAFFDSMLTNLRENARIYVAFYNDKPISSVLMLYAGNNATYHLGGSLRDYMNLGANNLLIYESAKALFDLGCKSLLLGGGYGGAEDSLFSYKKTLAPAGVMDSCIAKRVNDPITYDELVRIKRLNRSETETSAYFPEYRA